MKAIYVQRLYKLASFLRRLDRGKFNLASWVTSKRPDALPSLKGSCGTTACAVGWCPVVFPRLCQYGGLVVDEEYDQSKDRYVPTGKYNGNVYMTSYPAICGFEVAQELFGLSISDSHYLFNPSSYHKSKRGPKSVADRIVSFIAANGEVNHESKAYKREFSLT